MCARYALRGLAVHLDADRAVGEAPPALTAAVVRVLNEALANALKHAEATAVEVRLGAEPGAIAVAIADDGRGFEPAAAAGADEGHLGLALMRARASEAAGELTVTSTPGAGTTISARVPIPSVP